MHDSRKAKCLIRPSDLRGGVTSSEQQSASCQSRAGANGQGRSESRKVGPVRSTLWTINAGGLPGLWRMIRFLRGSSFDQRPDVVLVQEVQAHLIDWNATQSSLDMLGYMVHACNFVGRNKKGLVMLVKQTLQSRYYGAFNSGHGSALAVEVEGPMVCNVYVPPRDVAKLD